MPVKTPSPAHAPDHGDNAQGGASYHEIRLRGMACVGAPEGRRRAWLKP